MKARLGKVVPASTTLHAVTDYDDDCYDPTMCLADLAGGPQNMQQQQRVVVGCSCKMGK